MVQGIAKLAKQKKLSYGGRIVFRSGKIYLHMPFSGYTLPCTPHLLRGNPLLS